MIKVGDLMNIFVMPKVGFCYGVEKSIELAKSGLNDNYPKPYYLLGMIVHNQSVNDELEKLGFLFVNNNLDLLLNSDTTYTFISTAHGIKQEIKEQILSHNHKLIDTTCPIVIKNNQKIFEYFKKGYEIIYIGKNNHQESNVVKEFVHIVESITDLEKLNINNNLIVLTNQTTMSIIEINEFEKKAKELYPNILIDTIICPATKERQDTLLSELKKHHGTNDKWIVIGDIRSNNTNKLVDLIKRYTQNVYFIHSKNDIENLILCETDNLYITSGTSTPSSIIYEIVEILKRKNSL